MLPRYASRIPLTVLGMNPAPIATRGPTSWTSMGETRSRQSKRSTDASTDHWARASGARSHEVTTAMSTHARGRAGVKKEDTWTRIPAPPGVSVAVESATIRDAPMVLVQIAILAAIAVAAVRGARPAQPPYRWRFLWIGFLLL